MYTSARRFGLGDATTNVDDFPAVVAALGLSWTPASLGFATWDDALNWVHAGNGTTPLNSGGVGYVTPAGVPAAAFVALVQCWTLFHQTLNNYLRTADNVIASLGVSLVSGVPGTAGAVYNAPPPDLRVSLADWRAFASSVVTFAPALDKLFDTYAPGEVVPSATDVAVQSAVQVWNSELAAGALAIPRDSNTDPIRIAAGVITKGDYDQNIPAGHYVVPLAEIVEGPTLLPDGNWYVVYHSDPLSGKDTALTVSKWGGPKYVGEQAQNVSIRPDQCIPLVPGTGSWYWNTALTGSDPSNPCTGVPIGWSQGFGLVGPLVRQAMQAASAAAGIQLKPIPPFVPLTSAPAAAPARSVAPAPAVGPATLYPPPTTAPAAEQAPPPATQPMYAAVPTVQPSTVVNVAPASAPEVLYQSPTTVGPGDTTSTAPAPAASDTGKLLLGGALLTVGLFGLFGRFGAKRRNRR